MRMMYVCTAVLFPMPFATASLSAEEPIHWDVVGKIMEEAFSNSEAFENASWLADVFGPRDAKTPAFIAAANWARNKLEEYGLSNARLEPYEFGTGYSYNFISVHMLAPQYMPIIAFPTAWSAGTNGKVTGNAIHINFDDVSSESDLEPYRGKLKNAIVFTHPIQKLTPRFEPMATVWSKEQLDELAKIPIGPSRVDARRKLGPGQNEGFSRQQVVDFVFAEGALTTVRTDGRNDFGTVNAGSNRNVTDTKLWKLDGPAPTDLVMAAEHYNRIMRILQKDIPVEMELNLGVNFHRGDPNDYNVVAEIPGTDLADEIVMLGSHLQSAPIGSGATDNAVGCGVTLEVMRIFKKLDLKPRRTVRIGLWGGHEIGLIGNRAHVAKNFADFKKKDYKEDYDNLSAYFNVDHGTGKIRAVTIAGNEVLRSIFTEWMKPLHGIGMEHLFSTKEYIGGNPGIHDAYAEVGLPGFYFYQDRMDMDINAHTNMDMIDRVVEENLRSNAVVLATFVYHAAMRDEKLPRIAPLPW